MQTMHLLPSVAIQPNLELKTWPEPVLGSLPLAFALPDLIDPFVNLKKIECCEYGPRLLTICRVDIVQSCQFYIKKSTFFSI
jgi:hypothetical protein